MLPQGKAYNHLHLLLSVFILGHWVTPTQGDAAADLITDLPGLTFDPGFAQYSGFLPTTSGNLLHYWLVESQSSPSTDPLVLWLNGGPGCSSLLGFLTENGPFRVDQDGQTLFENVYSWNKGANVLYLESPRGVGYSYRNASTTDTVWSDTKTAIDNADALEQFFQRFPQYQNRQFFITGESYAGVYIPTLTNVLIQRIKAGNPYNINLVGLAIGNGILSEVEETNSVIDLFYYRGMLGKDQFDSLVDCCKSAAPGPLAYCNFSQYIDWNTGDPIVYSDPTLNQCAQKVNLYSDGDELNDAYNSYQDCYMDGMSSYSLRTLKMAKYRQQLKKSNDLQMQPLKSFVNQGSRINIGSTDAQYGYPCWADDVTENYLNLPNVRSALHIPTSLPSWSECNDEVNGYYDRQNLDMTPVFDSIISTNYNLRVLIFNGDVDTVCNFLGDEWFIMKLAKKQNMQQTARYSWTFQDNTKYLKQLGGYRQQFSGNNITIELLTVKGAGHMVPMDRGGPALQMITNFIQNNNYNTTMTWNTTPKPILPKYKPKQREPLTRKERDRIWYLPGLTYEPNFKQYSGYLNGGPGEYLFYWLVESQGNPTQDPLVLWLNGGPGCSSVGGFLFENGPFRPNPDNKTLFENNYAWNKVANVLYLESPRFVGFSWQNYSINPDQTYDDDKTAQGSFLALMDFLTVFPEYVNRPFYITGESYAGIYIPTLTAYTIDQILIGNAPGLNLIGIAIGNGELSMLEQFNSLMTMLYYRGIYGYDRYSTLMNCCKNRNLSEPVAYCDFSQYVRFLDNGNATAIEDNSCTNDLISFAQSYIWNNQGIQDVYNLYEDGYRQYPSVYNIMPSKRMRFGSRMMQAFAPPLQLDYSMYSDRRSKINYDSTDGKGNFYWYQQPSTPVYLNLADVRTALHVPPYVQQWADCNDTINDVYIQQHNDTTPIFQHILDSAYPLNILIYNGDVDTACQFLGDEWFIEKLAKMYSMPTILPRTAWTYQAERAGYWKEFQTPTGTLHLVTVKGAGHYVPLDRPGPALQMLANFIAQADPSTPISVSTSLSPLKPQYRILEQITDAIGSTGSRTKRSVVENNGEQNVLYQGNSIKEMPGQTFEAVYESQGGYLSDGQGNQLHYWWFPSTKASNPVIIWLGNGNGPACSVLFDALVDIGLYRVNTHGTLLYENPYSWNHAASILFLEAIPGVGFSSNATGPYNDTVAVNGIVNAIEEFYIQSTSYSNEYYIFGKGYGAIYATLAFQQLLTSTSGINVKGLGLGNSLLSFETLINIMPNELYYSGLLGKDEWDQLIPCCLNSNGEYQEPCQYSQYVTFDDQGNVNPKDQSRCAQLTAYYAGQAMQLRTSATGNMYRSCYEGIMTVDVDDNGRRVKRQAAHLGPQPLTNNFTFINQENRINYRSTDAFASYPCYMYYSTAVYLNLLAVRQALSVETNASSWQICNLSLNYTQQPTRSMASALEAIIQQSKQVKILVFDGDSHLQNNFLANEVFIETLAKQLNLEVTQTRNAWTYQESSQWLQQYAGYVKSFANSQTKTTLDLLTVKGAGYYIGLDRPGPALQMIINFLNNESYNTTQEAPVELPTLPEYQPSRPLQVSRRLADKIFDLPGLTYKINFDQYSGYLKGTKGNYLHYWFVESQNVPNSDPLIIWFNGGPGCSSLGGLLSENGPFRPNPDGITLFENVFSWNKLANVLYIESPRQVGFSYQDWTENPSDMFNDTWTKIDAYTAILDFFTIFPNFTRNDLYISGESYGGVYVPTLTAYIIEQIQAGSAKLNLKGMIVGNGYLSAIMNVRSLPNFLYFHGIYGKDVWDQLQQCCPQRNNNYPTTECTFEDYIIIDSFGVVVPKPGANQTCANLVAQLAYDREWNTMNYVYNLYQDCYQQTEPILPFSNDHQQQHPLHSAAAASFNKAQGNLRINVQKLQADFGIAYRKAMPWSIYTYSTDALGGFPCYMYHGVTEYLSQSHVRDALHVPDYVQPWTFCSDNITYTDLYNDTTPFFESMLSSNYPLRVLIYSGDVDTACSMFEAEWFIENFTTTYDMQTVGSRGPWLYQLATQFSPQIGGYSKRFQKNNFTIDLVTVKGAGHMVPVDRAGPMLQLLTNFVRQQDFNDVSPFSYVPQPLLPQFRPEPYPSPTTSTVRTTTTTYQTAATPPLPTTTTTKKTRGASTATFSSLTALTMLLTIFLSKSL